MIDMWSRGRVKVVLKKIFQFLISSKNGLKMFKVNDNGVNISLLKLYLLIGLHIQRLDFILKIS